MNKDHTFRLEDQSHTFGNVIVDKLLEIPHVTYAAYRQPDLLERKINIRICTTPNTTPFNVFQQAKNELMKDSLHLKSEFLEEVEKYKKS